MPDTNIIPFRPPARKRGTLGTGGFRLTGTEAALAPEPTTTGTSRDSAALVPIEIDKLYPADKEHASDLIAALSLLAEAIGLLEDARVAARNKEAITADRCWQRFESLLPRLFAHRKIGDGYGAVINALHFACANQHGTPLTFEQLTTVWRIVKQLRNAPVTPFEEALRYVQELEDCGLQIYPVTISDLVERTDQSEDD